MERAGAQAARGRAAGRSATRERWTVVCGGGSNGGDGRIVARHLEERGQGGARRRREGGRDRARRAGGDRRRALRHRVLAASRAPTARGADRADQREPARACSRSTSRRASTRRPARSRARPCSADETVTFHGRKVGARRRARPLPRGQRARRRHRARARARPAPRSRRPSCCAPCRGAASGDNKYTAGHVLVVGGSRGLTGAPSLTALAAMRADAGYVTVAAPESTLPVLEQRLLEAVKRPLPDDDGIVADGRGRRRARARARRRRPSRSGRGSGAATGRGSSSGALLAELELPVVVDADALFELEPGDWPAPRVLTPHEGELGAAARARVERDRRAPARVRARGRRAVRLRRRC